MELGIFPSILLELALEAPDSETWDVGAIVSRELDVTGGFGYLLLRRAIPVKLVGEHLPEGCQWEGVASRPSIHLQDQIVDAWSAGELDVESHKGLISRRLHG